MSAPTPYYQDDAVCIYHGDCREIAPSLTYDAVVSDPPYGIRYASTHNSSRSGEWAKWVRDANFDSIAGDDEAFDPAPWLGAHPIALCGANYFAHRLPPTSCWVVWDKRDGIGPNDQADCEMVWTNFNKPARLYRHLWSGLLRAGRENVARASKLHPHQKPEGLMEFLIGYGEIVGTILDPFMGSGTTLVAAKRLGRKAIGIELERSYCDLAVERLRQSALPLEMGA